MGFSKALPLQADSLKHLSSLQRRIVKGAVEQSGEASSGPSPVCPVVVSLPEGTAPILSTDTESVFGHIFDQISWG